MVLKICCKLSSEYLGTLIAAVGDFGLGDLLDYLKIFDLGGGEEPGGAMERATKGTMEGATEGTAEEATKGAMEGRSRRE